MIADCKEIGGYFEFEHFSGDEYHPMAVRLNSGRNCLEYLAKAKNLKKIYLPYYLCNSIKDTCSRINLGIEYYHVNNHFEPTLETKVGCNEAVFLVNYYGMLTNEDILILKEKYRNVIADFTHSFFQMPTESIDTIYSCRKFFGVPDGAYLYTDASLKEELETEVSSNRLTHLIGRFEGYASDYYIEFTKAERVIKEQPLRYMSAFTQNILRGIDYKAAMDRRIRNFEYLNEKLQYLNEFEIDMKNVPFAYPFYTLRAQEMRSKLILRKIYIPMLWADTLSSKGVGQTEKEYVENILPLPVDQRYGEEEMTRIINEVIRASEL